MLFAILRVEDPCDPTEVGDSGWAPSNSYLRWKSKDFLLDKHPYIIGFPVICKIKNIVCSYTKKNGCSNVGTLYH